MKVPTANVIVGLNKKVMKRLFSEGATYSNLIDGLSKDNEGALLFDNDSNPNFIAFEHSFGYKMDNSFTLSFIDPEGSFENTFFSNNMLEQIAGSYHSTPEKLKSAGENQGFCEEVVRSNELMKDTAFKSDFVDQYKAYTGRKKFYIAYGTGDNLDLWSGPHEVWLMGANVKVKGPRKIELRFAGNIKPLKVGNRKGLYNESIDKNIDMGGMTNRFTGFSEDIEFKNLLPLEGDDDYELVDSYGKAYNPLRNMGLTESDQLVKELKIKNENFLREIPLSEIIFRDFDLHYMVVDALRRYIQNATNNNNVIVLLPNLNLVCRQLIRDLMTNARIDAVTAQSYSDDQFLLSQQAAGTTSLPFPISSEVVGDTLGPAAPDFSFLGVGSEKLEGVRIAYDPILTEIGRKKQFLELFLSNLGLSLNSVRKGFRNPYQDTRALPQQYAGAKFAAEKGRTQKERATNHIKANDYQAYIEASSKEGLPDHHRIIKDVISNINKATKGIYQIDLAFVTETQVSVLDYWSGTDGPVCKKYPLFGGYTDFSEDKEAIIIGDKALINQYLYGAVDLENEILKEAEALDWTKLMERADFPEKFSSGYSAQIPLHPLDRQVLVHVGYQKRINKLIRPETSNIGSFGDFTYIPDEFTYKEKAFDDHQLKFIKEKQTPIFRYNTSNPNVLELKFNYDAQYMQYLKSGYTKGISRRASAAASGILNVGVGSFKIASYEAAFEYIARNNFKAGMGTKARQALINTLSLQLDPSFVTAIGIADEQAIAESLVAIMDKIYTENNLFGTYEVDQMLPGEPISLFVDFANQMFRKTFSLTLRTLPVFHLSNLGTTLQSPCIVFAQDQDIRQTISPNRSLLNKFYSGQYVIQGFKHTINMGTCQSEFVLTKNAPDFKRLDKAQGESVGYIQGGDDNA